MPDQDAPKPPVPAATRRVGRLAWHRGAFTEGEREIPEEMPVALSYNRVSHAVMMASPLDLEDFALGFSLSEQIVTAPGDIEEIRIVVVPGPEDGPPRGIELRLWIGAARMAALDQRRRHVAGPTGCGMCGLESLDAALRPSPPVPDGCCFTGDQVQQAVASLRPAQALNRLTRAVHAAGFWTPADGLVAVREDVGRHNALDKLHGALAARGTDLSTGILVMTSRISVELVQKAAIMGAPVLAAVSAPTALALRVAEQAGITLVAVARDDGFELCSGRHRITA
ncbi:formate dehydrogenase accessory sulfurtransferase FdhD [Lichenicola sp.]|uniref:formate dehydrogenase accessory sulfurtransferase FdhD n=1 Tax=Lichenicola sp. TaxID=2804529 RepID=UPI003AFFD60B